MSNRSIAIARSVAIIGATGALIAGMTFAFLGTNQVTLAANQLSVTTNVLQISNGGAFGTSPVTGFNFSNLVINDESGQQAFYLANTSGAALSLAAQVTSTPVYTNVDPTHVNIKIYGADGTTVLASGTLAAFIANPIALTGQLNANAQGNGGVPDTNGNYFLTMEVDSAGVTGPTPSVTGIDLSFTGTSL